MSQDFRFPSPGQDERFDGGGDIEHDNYPEDGRFPSPGTDTRFEGGYAGSFAVNIGGLTDNPTYGLTAQIGVELSFTTDPVQTVTAQRWFVGGVQKVTTATYTPVAADDGLPLYVEVDSDAPETVRSATYTVRYAPPVNTVAPLVTGDNGLGDTLTTTTGTWTSPDNSFTYEWLRNGTPIAGATASSYTITLADSGAALRSRVTNTNSGGAVAVQSSNTITVQTFAAPAITTPAVITPSAIVDDETLTITSPGVWSGNPSPTVTWVWRKGTTPIPGTENAPTYTPDEARSDYNILETADNGVGSATAASNNASATLRPQAVPAGALGPYSFTEGVLITPQDLSADFTTNGNMLLYAIVGTPLPPNLSVSPTGIMSGTPAAETAQAEYTVRATDEYGRTTDSTFNLAIDAAGDLPIVPTWTLGALVSGGNGNPDSVTVTAWDKNGSTDTHTAWIATANTATPATPAQIRAGSGGGIIERDSQNPYDGGQVDLTGFDTNAGVTHLHYFAEENNNGGVGTVQVLAIAGFDFEAPTISTATIENATPAVVDVVADKNLLGTTAAGAWAVSTKTVSGTSFTPPSTDVGVTLSADVTEGETLTLDYTGNTLTNDRGKLLLPASAISITNNVTPGPGTFLFTDDFNRADENLEDSPNWSKQAGDPTLYKVISNQLSADAGASIARYFVEPSDGNIAANCYAEMDIVQMGGNSNNWLQFNLRADRTLENYYSLRFQISPDVYSIRRHVGGSEVVIYTSFGDGGATFPPDGTRVRFEVTGDGQITVKYDGNVERTVDDSGNGGPSSGDIAGLLLRRGGEPNPTFDNYECGDL